MKTKLIACFILLSFWAKGQTAEATERISNLMQELYQTDSSIRKMIDEFSFENVRSKHNDSILIGKFPLVLTKGGKAWFDRFCALSGRVKFTKNLNDNISDLNSYYQNEIQTLDYDSIDVGGYFQGNDTLFGELIEGFQFEWYTFFKAGKVIKHISLSFLGGRELYSWRDEPNSRMTYSWIVR